MRHPGRKMLPAGAVLLRWPADEDRGEKETLSWKVLIPKKWNKTTQYGWRYDPRDVPRKAPAAAPAAAPEAAAQVRCRL